MLWEWEGTCQDTEINLKIQVVDPERGRHRDGAASQNECEPSTGHAITNRMQSHRVYAGRHWWQQNGPSTGFIQDKVMSQVSHQCRMSNQQARTAENRHGSGTTHVVYLRLILKAGLETRLPVRLIPRSILETGLKTRWCTTQAWIHPGIPVRTAEDRAQNTWNIVQVRSEGLILSLKGTPGPTGKRVGAGDPAEACHNTESQLMT